MISLTGDVATGRKMLEAAAKSVKRTHLELGGKAPVIVFDDADLDAVVTGLQAFGYYNAGQDCTAACRVYAGRRIYERLVADLSTAVAGIRYDARRRHAERHRPADQRSASATGSPASSSGPATRSTSRSPPAARPGGNGFYYAPTVVAGARQEDEIVRREVFGPVVSVTRFSDVDAGRRLGQRQRLRPRLLGLDPRRRPRHGDRGAAPLRLHLGQHPLHAGQRDAARRPEAVRLRQGHVHPTRSRTTPPCATS